MLQPHLVAGEVARGRRQVVGGDRGEAPLAPLLGGQRAAVGAALEPEDRGAEDAAGAQEVAGLRRDHAEVLPDDDGAGPVRLEGEHADQRLVVVADVGALVGRAAGGDPPEPEQADDVVDPDPAGVPEHGADQVAERLVAELGEPVRPPRRLAPVLAELVVGVRRRADLDALRVDVLQPPRVGAAGVHADREVVHDAEPHPGAASPWPGPAGAARRAPTAASTRSRPGRRASRANVRRPGSSWRPELGRPLAGRRCRGPRPARSRSRSRRARRPRAGGTPRSRARGPRCAATAWTIRSAARLAVQLASRSTGSCGVSHGRSWRDQLVDRVALGGGSAAYSGIRSTRR